MEGVRRHNICDDEDELLLAAPVRDEVGADAMAAAVEANAVQWVGLKAPKAQAFSPELPAQSALRAAGARSSSAAVAATAAAAAILSAPQSESATKLAHSAALASGDGRTRFFALDEDVTSCDAVEAAPEGVAASRGPAAEVVLETPRGRERRELELAKVNLRRAVQRQQQVDESVGSLLQRLSELPSAGGVRSSSSQSPMRTSCVETTVIGRAASTPASFASLPSTADPTSPPPSFGSPGPCSPEPSRATRRDPPCTFDGDGTASPEIGASFVQLGQKAVEQPLLLETKDADLWYGWTIQTSRDGRLFYHHAKSHTSQWEMPKELVPALGEWTLVGEGEAGSYWRNELLGVSAWKDPRHTTNLFQAALDGNLFFLQLYAEVGGYLDAVDAKGRSALHYNCAGGSVQAVLFLLHSKAALDLPDHSGSTPLHWACRYGHAPIVRILLEARADPDVQNSLGDTCMHEAAVLGRVDPLHWLVSARADPTRRNRESRTPSEVAARCQASEAEALLQRHERRHLRKKQEGTRLRRRTASHGQDGDNLQAKRFESEAHEYANHEPSLALVMVRAARPLLRGVQWLANRVLGEDDLKAGSMLCCDRRRRNHVTLVQTVAGGSVVCSRSEGVEEG
mmetsp:Transcript_15785/g.43137  ORF Transcript_15785/g.43137 Transcript_15785/m.43137 type:complete len:627 (-) Transcript_15785:81-1961(-)